MRRVPWCRVLHCWLRTKIYTKEKRIQKTTKYLRAMWWLAHGVVWVLCCCIFGCCSSSFRWLVLQAQFTKLVISYTRPYDIQQSQHVPAALVCARMLHMQTITACQRPKVVSPCASSMLFHSALGCLSSFSCSIQPPSSLIQGGPALQSAYWSMPFHVLASPQPPDQAPDQMLRTVPPKGGSSGVSSNHGALSTVTSAFKLLT